MRRLVVLTPVIALLALAGCGDDDKDGGSVATSTTTTAPTATAGTDASTVPGSTTGAGADAAEKAAYKLEVTGALDDYNKAQRKAFKELKASDDADSFVDALKKLRDSTNGVARRLAKLDPPAVAATPHKRFIRAYRALGGKLQDGIDARNTGDAAKLRRVGQQLASGAFSKPITKAARQIDAALTK